MTYSIPRTSGLFIIILLIFSGTAHGQKPNFEQAEQFTTQMMEKMTGSTQVDPHWIEDTDRFWYSYETGEGKNWFYVDAAEPSRQKLFNQEDMASKLTQVFNKPFDSKDLPLKEFEI